MLVAQLDRALDSDSKGRRFESYQARQKEKAHAFACTFSFVVRLCRIRTHGRGGSRGGNATDARRSVTDARSKQNAVLRLFESSQACSSAKPNKAIDNERSDARSA